MRTRAESFLGWPPFAGVGTRIRRLSALLALALALAGFSGAGATPLADPAALPGTFVGGDSDAQGRDVAVAANGDLILVGQTQATDLPVTDASSLAGGTDVFVARFDARVRSLKWLVYLGGSSDDFAAAVAVDASGNVYVTGSTDSSDFPTTSAYDAGANGGTDVFVAKLAAANGSALWSTYLGGSSGDEARDIVVDGSGRAIVVGTTASSNFPTVSAFGSDAYLNDAFVTRFAASGASLELSSYYSDARREVGVAVDVDAEGDIYVGVYGRDSESAYQINEVLKISGSGLTLTWAFVLDPSPPGWNIGRVILQDIAVSDGGVVAFAGELDDSQSTLPIVSPWQAAPGGRLDFFVGKMNGAGSAIDWSTYLGGADDEGRASIALTSDEKVWVSGIATSADFPLRQSFYPLGAGVSLLAADGQELLFSTKLGGYGIGELEGIALASDSVPVLAGSVYDPGELPLSGLLPTTGFSQYAFVARLEPISQGRFLSRRSISLPPLETVVEPYPWGALDLDSDGRSETYFELPDRSLDLAFGPGVVLDRFGDGRQLLSIAIGTLGGARVAGAIDQDGDGEPELVVEDPRLDGGVVEGWLLDSGDQDVDLVVVGRGGATGSVLVDLDGDGEQEVVVAAPHLADGAVSRLNFDPGADADTDVLFIGGLPRAVLDLDGDGELEVVAERGGAGGTVSAGSVEPTSDGDDDVIFLAGVYAFARDFDADGQPEIVAGDSTASPGSFSVVGSVIFVGGSAQTTADVDGDEEAELVVYDAAAAEGTFDGFDGLDGSDSDADVVFVGGAFRGTVDLDRDGEPELVVEDGAGSADTFALADVAEAVADGDPDLIAIRGTAVAAVDLDGDGELEIAADSGAQAAGAYLDLDGAESPGDGDADVVFAGGVAAAFADLDGDWEIELVVEDAGASPGSFDPLDGVESPGDGDADVVFVAGLWRAVRDLDQDGELEVLAEDAGLGSAASGADGIEAPGDGDPDVIFVAASFLTLRDLDGDGEPEIVVEDAGLAAPSASFADFVESPGDGDRDLVSIPFTGGFLVADLDGDGEAELILERSGGSAGATAPVDGAETTGDGDADLLFVGGVPALVADLDGDSEAEVVVSSAITAGTVSVYRTVEGGGDGDPDLVYAGGTARGYYDADGDWENEAVVENGSGGASSRFDGVDAISDPDADVIFTGGRVGRFADIDNDGELEAIAADSAASPGSSSRYDGADGDADADVIYLAGTIQGELDLDGDSELEIAATDAGLAGGTAIDPTGWDGDGDGDGVLAGIGSSPGSPSLTVTAPNGGGSVTIGNPLTIAWTASGFAGAVRIELSRDGGSSWEILFADTPNDGSEVWTSDGAPTGTALIRVISRNLAAPASDDSDATFDLI